ncbi:hypothetical protein L1987_34189 [Smallanthus sonchifolius]|uniref:Uncharacterized protein n=1 Tax=Smallanthus sonchifolius TaxID=185202 RepID=A0ACB9HUU7_9ASTR|nr:hypothetical protein L1987_34189 [Smallanthus sonchifolius]
MVVSKVKLLFFLNFLTWKRALFNFTRISPISLFLVTETSRVTASLHRRSDARRRLFLSHPSRNSLQRSKCNGTMIRLFKVKEKQKEEAGNANGRGPLKKQSAGELRLHKDISELNLPKSCTISFPNGKDDLMTFEVSIKPDEGCYMGGKFLFIFNVSAIYPHEAPKVKCKTKKSIYCIIIDAGLETRPQHKYNCLRIVSSSHGTKS